jgi:tryprostatin B 6-hydroxylase
MSDWNSLPYSIVLATTAGLISFFLYFHKGEHHLLAPLYLKAFVVVNLASTAALVYFGNSAIYNASFNVAMVAGSWLLGVLGSCFIWRAFFNPLNKFPGPWMARISKFYMSYLLRNMDAYYTLTELHAKYGQYVRLGPNDLSIVDPDAIPLAYGPNATVTKSEWYDAGAPHHSMHTVRDKAVHDRRRRYWAPAFSDKALRDYEGIMQDFNAKLLKRIDEFQGGPVNVTKWFNLYSFDVMGRLAFGKDFSMLDSGERHWALKLLTDAMATGALQPPMWAFRVAVDIPFLTAGYHKFIQFCTDQTEWRVARGDKDGNRDITGWILKAYEGHEHPGQDPYLVGDARLIIVAGSDTSAATLTYLFYHLALDPSQTEKLRAELKPLVTDGWSDKDIQHAKHLNAVINETLRLHPPVPSGVSRKTANEGLQIGDVYVPGNVHFVIPQYPMGRGKRQSTSRMQRYSNHSSRRVDLR